MYDKKTIGMLFAYNEKCPFSYTAALSKEKKPLDIQDGKDFYIGYVSGILKKIEDSLERMECLKTCVGQILDNEAEYGNVYADAVISWAKENNMIFPSEKMLM